MCLLRKIVRWSGAAMSLSQLLVCLNIFSDVGLLQVFRHHKYISVKLMQPGQKADLNASHTMQTLQALKG